MCNVGNKTKNKKRDKPKKDKKDSEVQRTGGYQREGEGMGE